MNKWLSIFLFLILTSPVSSQDPQPQETPEKPAKTSKGKKKISKTVAAATETAVPEPSATPADPDAVERARFDKAIAAATSSEKAKLLRAFVEDFPSSEMRADAVTYLVTARAMAGDEKLQAGASAEGIASFKLAVEEAAAPIPDRLFNDVILKIPLNLFYRDQRAAAFELAQLIEKKVSDNPKQLLGLVTFHLGVENGADARRIAEAAIALDPASPGGYQALGLAHRLNFDIEESAKAYAKAVELDPASAPAQRSLAEMKRALGKPDEAAAIYRSILAANDKDPAARGGLVMSLFDGGKQAEAEAELAKTLEREPRNFSLLASVAYWYAANKQGDKAVEHAQKAIDIEPRYVWSHIALARGLMARKQPVDAEKALIKAKQYGNFPTLEYELASARFSAGLFRDAAEELAKTFTVTDGVVRTRLGGRIPREANSFADLVAYERRAGILQPTAADDPEASNKLKILLEMNSKVAASSADEEQLAALADEFVKGEDKMKLHRQLHVANLYLQKNVALPKVAEILKASVGNADAGLDVSAPAAAVMASELYESRTIAFSRNEMVLIPDIPRQTLSAILRGRIEELTGWALYQQKNYPEAAVRLRRAISVLPDKSAWWRSSMWRLGAALEADGKDKEALDSYIQSYKTDRPSALRYAVIEALYRRVNGGIEGLEEKIGASPVTASAVDLPKAPETAPPPSPAVSTDAKAVTDGETKISSDTKAANPPTSDVKAVSSAVQATSEPAVHEAEPKVPAVVERKKKIPAVVPTDKNAAAENKTDAKTSVPVNEEVKKAPVPQDSAEALAPAADKDELKKEPVPPQTVPVTDSQPVKTDAASGSVEKATEKAASAEKTDVSAPVLTKPEKPAEDTPAAVQSQSVLPQPQEKAAEPKDIAGGEKNLPEAVEKAAPVKDAQPPPLETKTEPAADLPPVPVKDSPAQNQKTEAGQPVKGEVKENTPPAVPEPAKPEPAKASETQPVRTDPERPPDAEPAKQPEEKEPAKPAGELTARTEAPPPRRAAVIIDDPLNSNTKPKIITARDRSKPASKDRPKPESKPTSNKALFEPIIITVPRTWVPTNTQTDPNAIKVETEPAADDAAGARSRGTSGAARSRVIKGKEIVSDQKCSIDVSPESVSLLNGGGSIGVQVSVSGDGSVSDVSGTTSSARDLAVRPEPDLEGVVGRRFYVIKSTSARTGIFRVNFESPCGKKEVTVRVQ